MISYRLSLLNFILYKMRGKNNSVDCCLHQLKKILSALKIVMYQIHVCNSISFYKLFFGKIKLYLKNLVSNSLQRVYIIKVCSTSQNEFILRNLFKFQFIVLIVKYNCKATCLTYLYYLKINIPTPESRNLQYFAVLYIRGITSF